MRDSARQSTPDYRRFITLVSGVGKPICRENAPQLASPVGFESR